MCHENTEVFSFSFFLSFFYLFIFLLFRQERTQSENIQLTGWPVTHNWELLEFLGHNRESRLVLSAFPLTYQPVSAAVDLETEHFSQALIPEFFFFFSVYERCNCTVINYLPFQTISKGLLGFTRSLLLSKTVD